EIFRDLRYSLRIYRGRALSAVFAILSRGLAIGTCTAVFSVLNALLLRGLPFRDPAALVQVEKPPATPRHTPASARWCCGSASPGDGGRGGGARGGVRIGARSRLPRSGCAAGRVLDVASRSTPPSGSRVGVGMECDHRGFVHRTRRGSARRVMAVSMPQ